MPKNKTAIEQRRQTQVSHLNNWSNGRNGCNGCEDKLFALIFSKLPGKVRALIILIEIKIRVQLHEFF